MAGHAARTNDRPRPIGRLRWGIAALLGGGVIVNYLDRVTLTVAGPAIQTEFGLGPAEFGMLLGAFGWTYAALQIPMGLLLDRVGTRRVMLWSTAFWSLASFGASLATGFRSLFVMRMALGVAEAPIFPANAKATGYWFPRGERGLATALFDSAAKFSNVIAVPLVAFFVLWFGWRGAFAASAVISLCYFGLFRIFYRNPAEHPRLSAAERTYIAEGGAIAEGQSSRPPVGLLGYLLSQRKVWGLSLGFGAYAYGFTFFITWLPGYFVQQMHMTILSSAAFTAIPWAFATIADLAVGGWLIDRLIANGHDETRVRKSILIGGMITGLAVAGAAFTENPVCALVWITFSLSGLAAAAPAGWSLPALVAPRGGSGTVGGIMNFCNGISTIAAPMITGFIVGATHSFAGAFLFAGAILAGGILSYAFLLGPIVPIAEPPATDSIR